MLSQLPCSLGAARSLERTPTPLRHRLNTAMTTANGVRVGEFGLGTRSVDLAAQTSGDWASTAVVSVLVRRVRRVAERRQSQRNAWRAGAAKCALRCTRSSSHPASVAVLLEWADSSAVFIAQASQAWMQGGHIQARARGCLVEESHRSGLSGLSGLRDWARAGGSQE